MVHQHISNTILQRAVGYRLSNIELLVQSMFGRFKSPPIHNSVLGLDATIYSNILRRFCV